MKKLLALTSTAAAYLSLAFPAFAASVSACPVGDFAGICKLGFNNVVGPLITTIFIIAIIVALLYLVWGGFKWLTSGGDKAAVQSAREHIVAAIVGLVIIFLAYFVLNLVLSFFGIPLLGPDPIVFPVVGAD
ncbi:MAG: hypothetical protein COU25_01075 [Candidatus Levybacteria bacterium CG10_big_fil_rev_8_21_14_0_10_35_13]|nr:MAG: hypothetical protein COU25_01075 [Candidatus Levybacteria bacterium CG10_big_fil_rev_8_21_14_0_10_35_13]